jgi:hypothetical protein
VQDFGLMEHLQCRRRANLQISVIFVNEAELLQMPDVNNDVFLEEPLL